MNAEDIINRTVIANRLDSITQEMGISLEHSAHSPIFAEACDFACCICDYKGDLVSQLSGIPILATAGSFSVKSVIKKYGADIHDGDAFIINDPYDGGNHLPDIGIITPVFNDDELLFFCVSRAHHGDIGGSTAGSYNPKATEIFQEGIRIHPTRIVEDNNINNDIMDLITLNTRNPSMLKSDLLAQMGSNNVARNRLEKMIKEYGNELIKKVVEENLNQAEILTKKRILEVPDGEYSATSYIDDDSFQKEHIKIHVTVKIKDDNLTVDFTGTDKQVKGFVNTSIVTATAASGIASLWFLGADIPRNGGAFNAINVVLPKGSLVNPYEPAPMTLSTLTPASEIIGTIFKALNKAVPDRLPAGYGNYIGPSYYGIDPRNGRFYVGFSFCSLGSGGAMNGLDGKPYMSPMSNYGGVKAPNIESNEVQYPHITLRHEMECDTAGAGEFRGGAGIEYAFQIYDESSEIVMFGDGIYNAPYGLNGGKDGSFNKPLFKHDGKWIQTESKEYPRKVSKGDIVSIHSAGGGGYGNPYKRDMNKVLEDYLDDLISKENALKVYGVVINDDDTLNIEETLKVRG
ncbi:hydantoinase B/oxoprolinase family protein [Methanosphaera sp. ISO3-F5]|uniref:hydantoinase B/oxoprolinase family protein n=1 Tax=Methanosphaera sp. ISO3-F5 TaxID=1452353 RepID=UPI002B256AE5|nr:hydantoinase B/oxoprolinase family protein [Methanosphaera sp. ISO3-F5]WQH63837.1 hydantoinase B/oxoprolinase family protein [Methanosphaera sp. ISO3-F5]